MIINDLDIFGVSLHPVEAQTELIIDPNAVLA
jgi:hypothetical protein